MPSDHTESVRGRLLVAAPPLVDPNFDRTVIFMLEHGAEGSLGLVLNRPSATELEDVLPDWRDVASDPARVFVGGPVAPESVIALARSDRADAPGSAAPGWVPLVDDLGTVDVGRDPAEVAADVQALRIFLGYAGWAPAQLEAELDQGAWFVVDALASDPFAAEPSELWTVVLRRQRSRVAMFAMCPPDPSVN